MSLTLVVLAAGMGSRFGGLKQIEPVGPAGEFILDYSIYDALRNGFGRVVFVVRRDTAGLFEKTVGHRIARHAEVAYVAQELDCLPPSFVVPPERSKPWGTGHAVWCCREVVKTPFAVINADDFYGRDAFRVLGSFLLHGGTGNTSCAMAGYTLRNTLSPFGTVARGVCETDGKGFLQGIVERTRISMGENGQIACPEQRFTGDEYVSMNAWGFNPSLFAAMEPLLQAFLRHNANNPGMEFYIPTVVNTLIGKNVMTARLLTTDARWMGITYPEDKRSVTERIDALIQDGVYTRSLWHTPAA